MVSSLIIVSGQSGAGKTSIVKEAIALRGGKRVITCTSRDPRPDEQDGVDYHFLPRNLFEHLLKGDAFVEYAEVYGNLYGTLKTEIDEALENFPITYVITDVQGAKTLMRKYQDAHSIFITYPAQELKERLEKRGEDVIAIAKRLDAFRDEQDKGQYFDVNIVNKNGELRNSIIEFIGIIDGFHSIDKMRSEK